MVIKAGKVAKMAIKPDDLSLIFRTHPVEGESRLLRVVLWSPDLGVSIGAHMSPWGQVHTLNKYTRIICLKKI